MPRKKELDNLRILYQSGALSHKDYAFQKKRVLEVDVAKGKPPRRDMTFDEAWDSAYEKRFDWHGRASRAEFWWIFRAQILEMMSGWGGIMAVAIFFPIASQYPLLMFILVPVTVLVVFMVCSRVFSSCGAKGWNFGVTFQMVKSVYIRRLHDVNHGLWMACLPLEVIVLYLLSGVLWSVCWEKSADELPDIFYTIGNISIVASFIIPLIYCALPGTPGTNKYGPPV